MSRAVANPAAGLARPEQLRPMVNLAETRTNPLHHPEEQDNRCAHKFKKEQK